ncbi:MAG: hypothetical protein ACOCVL_01015, partial [Candidatus Sumerlaeota bacterium]
MSIDKPRLMRYFCLKQPDHTIIQGDRIMLFRPKEHHLWDTTVFHDGEQLHLIYIAGEGRLGHAVSTDWVHWRERPLIE